MIRVLDRIEECWDGQYLPRGVYQISHIIVHRIGPEIGETAIEIARAFQDDSHKWSAGSYSGRQVPYTLLIRRDFDGTTEQMLALEDIGWHARRWSRAGVGIACVGDFHKGDELTPGQHESLIQICSLLALFITEKRGKYELAGHSELPFASRDPAKVCPGFDMSLVRSEVAARLADETWQDSDPVELLGRAEIVIYPACRPEP